MCLKGKVNLEIMAQLPFNDDLPLCVTAIPRDVCRPVIFRSEQCILPLIHQVSGLSSQFCACLTPLWHQRGKAA